MKCQLLKVCTRSLIDRMLGVTGCSHGNIIRRSLLCCSVSSLLATSAADDCCGNEHSFQQHRSIFAHFSNEAERKTGFGRSFIKHRIIRDFPVGRIVSFRILRIQIAERSVRPIHSSKYGTPVLIHHTTPVTGPLASF